LKNNSSENTLSCHRNTAVSNAGSDQGISVPVAVALEIELPGAGKDIGRWPAVAKMA